MLISVTTLIWIVCVAFLIGIIVKSERQHRAEQKRIEELTDNLIAKSKRLRNSEATDESDDDGGSQWNSH